MKRALLLMFLLFACHSLWAQSFYVVSGTGTLYRVTLGGGNTQADVIPGCKGPWGMSAIAIYNNDIYFIGNTTLSKASMANNQTSNCTSLTTTSVTSALTADANGILYYVNGTHLVSYNPVSNITYDRGDMHYTASGDLVFYKNDLYMANSGGIVRIIGAGPAQSAIVIANLPGSVWGLTTAKNANGEIKAYAFCVVSGGTDIIEIDLDNNQLGAVVGHLNFDVYDAASDVETSSAKPVNLDDVKFIHDCPMTGKGTVQLISNGATPGYQFTLNGQSNNTGIFTGVLPGNYTATIEYNGNRLDFPVAVPSFGAPAVALDYIATKPQCLTKGAVTVNMSAATPSIYQIKYNGALYELGHMFTGLSAGTYHFEVYSTDGCKLREEDYVLQAAPCPIDVSAVDITQQCNHPDMADVKVSVNALGNDVYTYKLNGSTNATGNFNNVTAGVYTLEVTSAGGGAVQRQVTVPDFSATGPKLRLTKRNIICGAKGEAQFSLSVNSAGYQVMLDGQAYSLDHHFTGLDSGAHLFTVLKPGNCILDTVTVFIANRGCPIIDLPNAFTPNGDGINDVFKPLNADVSTGYSLYIYNRNGAQVFASTDVTKGWDGQSRGKPSPAAVYYWVTTFLNEDGRLTTKSGYVTLIR